MTWVSWLKTCPIWSSSIEETWTGPATALRFIKKGRWWSVVDWLIGPAVVLYNRKNIQVFQEIVSYTPTEVSSDTYGPAYATLMETTQEIEGKILTRRKHACCQDSSTAIMSLQSRKPHLTELIKFITAPIWPRTDPAIEHAHLLNTKQRMPAGHCHSWNLPTNY